MLTIDEATLTEEELKKVLNLKVFMENKFSGSFFAMLLQLEEQLIEGKKPPEKKKLFKRGTH